MTCQRKTAPPRPGPSRAARSLTLLPCALLLAGCTPMQPQRAGEVPIAWAQAPAEHGTLPVGRVISIERFYARVIREQTGPGATARGIAAAVILPVAIVALPVLIASGALDDPPPAPVPQGVAEPGYAYRHVVRLDADGSEVVREEFWTYRVGDCVALREQPAMLVPALADACRPVEAN